MANSMYTRQYRFWILAGVAGLGMILSGCGTKPDVPPPPGPSVYLQRYLLAWQHKNYAAMYALLTPSSKKLVTKQAFAKRYTDISDGVNLTSLSGHILQKVQPKTSNTTNSNETTPLPKVGDVAKFRFETTWKTSLVGAFRESYAVTLVNEPGGWRVAWRPELIFPQLQEGWKVRAQTTLPKRGSITDANGVVLAEDVPGYDIGFVAGKTVASSASRLAKVLGESASDVESILHQSWVKPGLFVPVKTLPQNLESPIESRLIAIPGVMVQPSSSPVRWYPDGSLGAHVIGYVAPITAQELTKARIQQGYSDTDVIGQSGVEAAFENDLRGKSGGEIWIEDGNGITQAVVAQRDAVDGDTVRLTLDIRAEKALTEAMAGQVGGAVVLNPSTGAVLAMVSTPAYNPNLLSNGISSAAWAKLTSDKNAPLVNRALSAVTPGSVIKPFIASIGMDTKSITQGTVFANDSVEWQKDASWGNYHVTRVLHPGGSPDLLHALVWSDNVYFAQVGLKIGEKSLVSGLNTWGLGKPFSFDLPVEPGQISTSGQISSEIQLADSSYGQGQLLVSPLQLDSMFTAFLNHGNTLAPYLLDSVTLPDGRLKMADKRTVLQRNVVPAKTVSFIRSALRQVVTNPSGTGYGISNLPGWSVSGKTGTAQKQGGAGGNEWGWFGAWATPTKVAGTKRPYLITMVLSNTQNAGGSHETVHHVRQFLLNVQNMH